MKNGIAIRENEFAPANNLCAEVANEMSAGSMHSMATAEASPTETLMDTPIASITTNSTTITIAVLTASDIIRRPPFRIYIHP